MTGMMSGKNRKVNVNDVEQDLFDHGASTAAEVAARLGFSHTPIYNALERLTKQGIVKRGNAPIGSSYLYRPVPEPQWHRDRDRAVDELTKTMREMGLAAWVKKPVGPLVMVEMSWSTAERINKALQGTRRPRA